MNNGVVRESIDENNVKRDSLTRKQSTLIRMSSLSGEIFSNAAAEVDKKSNSLLTTIVEAIYGQNSTNSLEQSFLPRNFDENFMSTSSSIRCSMANENNDEINLRIDCLQPYGIYAKVPDFSDKLITECCSVCFISMIDATKNFSGVVTHVPPIISLYSCFAFSTKCNHKACLGCWREHVVSRINNFQMSQMTCVECSESLCINSIRALLRLGAVGTLPTSSSPLDSPVSVENIETIPPKVEPSTKSRSFRSYFNWKVNKPPVDISNNDSKCVPSVVDDYKLVAVVDQEFDQISASYNFKLKQADELLERYDQFLLNSFLVRDSDLRWCPAPSCGFGLLAPNCGACPVLYCHKCPTMFCYHCRKYCHSGNCPQFLEWRANNPTESLTNGNIMTNEVFNTKDKKSLRRTRKVWFWQKINKTNTKEVDADMKNETILTDEGLIKRCPRCQSFVVKPDDGTCNHMSCVICNCQFCWLCMKEITDSHYLSVSGCTFWGTKPWSKRKRLLWQLGILLSAPIGIAAIGIIAIPTIIIGLPIVVFRFIKKRSLLFKPRKKKLIIAVGLSLSILLSPLLAAIVVAIALPLILIFVYTAMLISICRNFSCYEIEYEPEPADLTMTATSQTPQNADNNFIENEDFENLNRVIVHIKPES